MSQKYISKILALLGVFVFFVGLGSYLLKSDFAPFMMWWIMLLILGIIFVPLGQVIFPDFFDGGFLFLKAIGFAVSGYLMWLLSSLKIVKFTPLSCLVIVLFCTFINGALYFFQRKNKKKMYSLQKITVVLAEEVLFFALFLVWTYIRGFRPEAHGTEKFMDYGFMTTMMRAEYMPPMDLWFSGEKINYYYVGQYLATFMTKLSHVTVNVGYNLMLMTLATFGFMLPFSLVYNLIKNYGIEHNKSYKSAPVVGGLLAGGSVSLAGNLHFTLFYFVIPIIKELFGVEGDGKKYWFPNSTRYIGYHPDTTDKTIHEFPSYSFVLGDLHAHVINLMFVLTVLGILYGLVRYKKNVIDNKELIKGKGIFDILNPHVILLSFFIGVFHTTNYWDYPIYYVVAGGVILFMNIKQYKGFSRIFLVTAIQGVFVMLAAKIFALPFIVNFQQISSNPVLTESRTPIYQLAILWGIPVYFVLGLLGYLVKHFKENFYKEEWKKNKKADNKKIYPVIEFIRTMEVQDLFVITIGLCAVGLVLIPEIIYIEDIYTGHKRANTMFKLTYQAFVMFGIVLGYIFVKFKLYSKFYWNKTVGYFMFFLFLTTLWYGKVSVVSWYGNVFKVKEYRGLDAAKFMKAVMPDDYLGTQWLNEHVKGTPVVLEAYGESYTDYCRVSVITGLPTVVGWRTHEHLWRDDEKIVLDRGKDVETIYNSSDKEEILTFAKKYDISYIYVGKLEYEKYTIHDEVLKSLGEVVFVSPVSEDKEYETYIIKLNK